MKIKLINQGCKVNAYETNYLTLEAEKHGLKVVNNDELSDISVINTCTVTNTAAAKARKLINKEIKQNPHVILAIIGCYSQENAEYFKSNPNIKVLLGNKAKKETINHIMNYLDTKKTYHYVPKPKELTTFEDMSITHFKGRKRAFVKIQDGCDSFCSYCVIPYVRGPLKSKDYEKVLTEVATLIKEGYKEIVLTGIHTGKYEHNLTKLIKDILKLNPKRLRISSIEIGEITDELLELIKTDNRLAKHLHIPLQSGTDKILKLMNRKYTTKEYETKINQIKTMIPDISVTTDIITGFPRETKEDFDHTYDFIKQINFNELHVFPYSKRDGTKAANLPDQIPGDIKKERVKQLLELDKQLKRIHYTNMLGKTVNVLIEKELEPSFYTGTSSEYYKIKVKSNKDLTNQFINVEITDFCDNYLTSKYTY